MKPTFFLEKPTLKEATRIILAVNHDKKKYKFSTGEKVEPGQWNKNKQVLKPGHPEAMEINERLSRLAKALELAINSLVRNGETVNRENLLKLFESNLSPTKTEPEQAPILPTFFEFVDTFIKDSENGTRLYDGRRLSKGTTQIYGFTLKHLRDFTNETNQQITFETLNMDFYNKLVSYFYSKGHTINSTGKHIKNVKVFANEAKEKGFPVHSDISRKVFKVLAEDTDQIALTIAELEAIEALDLSKNRRLDNIRDCFLIGCWTGLRFGDLNQLSIRNILDTPKGKRLKVVTEKTIHPVVIPLKPVIIHILDKYNGTPPTPPSNQKFNEYIKEVVELAGIKELVTVAKTRAGIRDEKTQPKYELTTVHTARRTFATNAYLEGMDTLTIMKMTGHKTEKSFLKYIRVSQEQNADRAAQHSFFQ